MPAKGERVQKGRVVNTVSLLTVIALLVTGAMFVRIRPTADSVAVLSATGISCGGCGSAIERALQAKKGVAAVEVDVNGGRVIVGFDSKMIGPAGISSTVASLGYRNSVADCRSAEQFRKLTGRDPGKGWQSKGCGDSCPLERK